MIRAKAAASGSLSIRFSEMRRAVIVVPLAAGEEPLNPALKTAPPALQLWVNLPAADKLTAPRYQDLSGGHCQGK